VAITIDESWRLLQNNLMPVPFGTRIRMSIGDPIERRPDEDPIELLAEVHRQIATNLETWRKERG
jgi:lysophospholipid acyltransferase (LPLAT)-like uncharacterized protein